MADNKIGAYHLSDNPTLYEPARSNTFEFVVTGLGQLLRAGYSEEQTNAFLGNNVEELLRISVVKASVPTFSQDAITIRRGNSVMKAAGLPSFKDGSLVINDYLGADGKSILMAWQNLSYNVKTEKVIQSDFNKIFETLLSVLTNIITKISTIQEEYKDGTDYS